MTARAKTEPEQVAFFEGAHERCRQAVANVGEVRHDYRVAGTVVRLSFAGARLVPYLTRAIEHLEINPVETPAETPRSTIRRPHPPDKSCGGAAARRRERRRS